MSVGLACPRWSGCASVLILSRTSPVTYLSKSLAWLGAYMQDAACRHIILCRLVVPQAAGVKVHARVLRAEIFNRRNRQVTECHACKSACSAQQRHAAHACDYSGISVPLPLFFLKRTVSLVARRSSHRNQMKAGNIVPYIGVWLHVDSKKNEPSLLQMEETHSQLFKRIKFNPEQRACVVGLWRDWQRHRRALDTQLEAACGRIVALPDSEELSDAFVAFVSSQCMRGAVEACTAEMACRLQPRTLIGLCPVATAAAKTAVQALVEVQDRDARIQVQQDYLLSTAMLAVSLVGQFAIVCHLVCWGNPCVTTLACVGFRCLSCTSPFWV